MSFPNIPDIKPDIDINLEDAVTLLLSSIAMEEMSISKMMDAETKKILGVVTGSKHDHCSGCGHEHHGRDIDFHEVIDVNNSVDNTVKNLIKLQLLLQFKLENVKDILPKTKSMTKTSTSTGTTTTCTKTTSRTTTCTTSTRSTTTHKHCMEDDGMNDQLIDITGVTPLSSYPDWSRDMPSIEICETDTLCLSKQHSPINCVVDIHVTVEIVSVDLVSTINGKKAFIEGIKHIKILYVAEDCWPALHAALFDIPFQTCFLLDKDCVEIQNHFSALEHIKARMEDCKCVTISSVIFIGVKCENQCKPSKDGCHSCIGDNRVWYNSHQGDQNDDRRGYSETERNYSDNRKRYFNR